VVIVQPIEDAPAHRAGMQAEDRLVSVDGEPLGGQSVEAAARLLRGPPGSEVKVVVARPGAAQPLQFTTKREIVRIRPKVEWLDGAILHIRFRSIQESTIGELLRALEQAVEGRKPAGMVVDLRDNTGGLLQRTAEIAGLFLEDKALVGRMKGKRVEDFRAGRPSLGRDNPDTRPSAGLRTVLAATPMVVLVNARTASGGEILAGALQAHGRAQLVGAPTSGIGSIQSIVPLGGNTAVKLTTHYWIAAGERMLEGNPLQPDIEVTGDDALPTSIRILRR
jgi:carboxyl-terminal processing protease